MITQMTGILTRVLDDEARLRIGAFEYQIMLPEAVRRQLQLALGEEITFHTLEYLEGGQNATRLIPRRIGFLHESEVEFFELFCTVEKIGVKKALKAMARPIAEIADAISRQDSRWLSTLPGIGPATAEQIVTTLKRKVAGFLHAPGGEAPDEAPAKKPGSKKGDTIEQRPTTRPDSKLIDDLYQALMTLGHSPIEARNKLDLVLGSGQRFQTVEEGITLIYRRQ